MNEILKYFPQLTANQICQLTDLESLYEDWNSKINVISRKDFDNFYLHHVLHSLSIFKSGLLQDAKTVMDVGCGGGFPVVPLAILYPAINFTAVDSIGKKIKVVQEIVTSIGLTNVSALNCRAESVDQEFDWVLSRAVTDLSTFIGWTWCKTRNGIIYLKGGDLTEEISTTTKKVTTFNISDWFSEPFFETKKILLIRK